MRKFYQALCKAEVALCGTGFVFLIVLILLSAILRFFRMSMAWNIDLALFLLAWTSFLGADIAWREGNLIGIDLVTKRLSLGLQKTIQLAIYLIVLCGLGIIVIFGIQLAITEGMRRYQSIPIPYSLAIMSLVTAAFLMIISTIIKIRHCIMNFGKEGKEEADE
jgi:TRAP-type C4-dicarboxylate transport system permease small subunit